MFSTDPHLVALAHGNVRVSAWESNPATDEFRWTSRLPDLYAQAPNEIRSGGDWLAMVHPEDRERLAVAIHRAIEGEGGFHEQVRVTGVGGRLVWVLSTGQAIRGMDGSVRILGINLDLSGLQEALVASEAIFHATFEQAAVGMALMTPDGRFFNANRYCCEILGYRKSELLQLSFSDVTHPADLDATWELLRTLLRGERRAIITEMRYFTRDKRLIWGNLTVSLMHKADSSPDCFIAVIEDITARKQNEDQLLEELDRRVRERTAELERLSFTDALTGIPNRRSLDQRLIAEWDRAVRSGDPVSVLLIDIDHFKGMNDTLGHAAADRALILVAAELNKVVHRTGDTPARYGGDEFVLLLPGTGAEGALKVARMFQGAIKWLDLANPGSGVAPILTVSQGVATAWPAKKGTSNKLMLAADKALLKAKHGGKNRIEVAPLQKQPERA